MALINLKTVAQKGFWFMNMKSLFERVARKNRDRPCFFFEGKTYTYGDVHDDALRYAKLFTHYKNKMVGEGRMGPEDQLAIGLYMDNCPEFIIAFFGAAISGSVIIGVNTGFRRDTLAAVVNRAEIGLLIMDQNTMEEVERTLPDIKAVGPEDIYIAGLKDGAETAPFKSIEDALSDPEIISEIKLPKRIDNFSPLIVIYTSGTTGEPKGVPCTHMKLIGAAVVTRFRLRLNKNDKGYICMPTFHSNAWFIGILPLILVGGSFVLTRKFSASAFESDVLDNGITYMNYVGQPIHYILVALEKKYGGPEGVEEALAKHPKNMFRIAHGNGAPAADRKKFARYMGIDHVYELYGSTEAPISTVIMPGEPLESVGKIPKSVVILNENGQVCPPGEVDEKGKLINYDQAVGEIAKIDKQQNNIIFDGYFKNAEATGKKFRGGYYRSGDLGHVRIFNGKRFLYFNGRTDDWIRKDGENFSAENVLHCMLELPDIALAAAHGAPCEVSDEKVMVALMLKKEASFDPQATFDKFMKMQNESGMDPKWMPDYIRIVDSFDFTHQTQKILIRPLKRQHFNLEKFPDMEIYFRQRGDTTYRELTGENFARIKKDFEKTDRVQLLYAGL